MIIPKVINLQGIVGAPFDQVFRLWQDKAHTVPFDATGLAISFTVDQVGEVSTVDGGVTISTNVITVHLDPSVTLTAKDRTKYRLCLADTNDFPARGNIEWTKP